MKASPAERSLQARAAAHISWARTTDRTARTHSARQGLEAKFLREADGDPRRAESVRRAYYLEMARKSAETRRRGRAALATLHRMGLSVDAA